ncbi:MAG: DUF6152 family protein [Acidimicrobiia bacterium]
MTRTVALFGSIVLAGAIVAVDVTVFAHHSAAQLFDQEKTIEIQGTVKVWRLSNPHPFLLLEVTAENNQKIDWSISFGNAAGTALRRRGWSAETLKVGELVRVKGHPAKAAGSYGIDGAVLTRADGKPVP